MPTTADFTVTVALAVLCAALLSTFLRPRIDAREPPIVDSKIPFIGHLIGMIRGGPMYIAKLSARSKNPMFTMLILNSRSYVVASPALAAQVQRATKTLKFDVLVSMAAPRMVQLDKATAKIIQDSKADGEMRVRMITRVFHDDIEPLLKPTQLDGIGNLQLAHFNDFFSDIKDKQQVELFKFLTREVFAASMHTFYGPENPFAIHPEMIEDLWAWESGMVTLMLDVLPQWTARKAYLGLKGCVKGFEEYLNKGRIKGAYEMLQRRQQAHENEGISVHQQARLEVAMCLGLGVNASITSFWLVNNIFSRPVLLADIRTEISANAGDGNILFAKKLRDRCPLLNSVYKESMRLISPGAGGRYVLEDTLIADRYLLKKGSVVQIPGSVFHNDDDIWGPDVGEFNPRRFISHSLGHKTNADGSVPDSRSNQVHPAAYRVFGGGASLCPGRFFAQLEILALTASIVMGFDLLPPGGRATVRWDPPTNEKSFTLALTKPNKPLNVTLRRREGMENIQCVMNT